MLMTKDKVDRAQDKSYHRSSSSRPLNNWRELNKAENTGGRAESTVKGALKWLPETTTLTKGTKQRGVWGVITQNEYRH